jgi:polar amino acid transport system substrate-binding protein
MLGFSLLLNSGCKKDTLKDYTIDVSCIEFTPNCFIEDGHIIGYDVDIAVQAIQDAGAQVDVKLSDSWDEFFNATLKGPRRALLTVGYSAARKNLFKWAGPTSQGIYYIFAKKKSGIGALSSIDAAKTIASIGVVKNWLETTTLEGYGFKNLVYYNTYDEALAAFKSDQVKAIGSDIFHLTKKLPAGYYDQEVEAVTRYHTAFYYIAFSRDVDDAIVEKCQNAINAMIESRKTLAIMQKYLPTITPQYVPGTIQIFTEVAPPYNYSTGSGATFKVEGSSTEIVNEIQRRNGFTNNIGITTWSDQYAIAQYLPNTAIYSTARTPEREWLFKWVGPISSLRTCFYTLTSSGIKIETVAQAKALTSIGTVKGWYTHEYLKNNNFQNAVVTALTPVEAFNQLINGQVQALLIADSRVKWMADNAGIASSAITEHIEVINYKGCIAFSLNTPAAIIQQWQNNLDAMRADGTLKTIWDKWYKGVPMP